MVVDTKHQAEADELDENVRLQQDTIETMKRIKEQAEETENQGMLTLEDLKRQRGVVDNANDEAERLNHELDETKKLQNRLGRWTLTFGREKNQKKPFGKNKGRGSSPKPTKSKDKKKKGNSRDSPPPLGECGTVSGVSSETKEKHAEKFKSIDDNDQEIDTMLGETADILERLEKLSTNVNGEVQAQDGAIDELQKNLTQAENKQHAANARARRFLTGKWRQRAEE